MIIGITGTLGAGKGTVVNFLVERGFKHFSVREFLIEEIKKRNLQVNRESMVNVANELRCLNSPSYIIERLYEKAKQESKDCIIESIRTPGEAEMIKNKGGVLIAVDAKQEIRYSRIISRQSETDNVSFEEFLEQEKKEMFSSDPNKQNLSKCIEISDFVIENNKDISYLKKQTEEIFKIILKNNLRPSWDEYFMKLAALVAERSTCLRHHVGAVIVRDKRVLTTGYNGAVKGTEDCLTLGCIKDKLNIKSGFGYETCRAVHAEQNAIVQAANHGTSVKDATIYCTHTPCMICAKLIVNSGIKEVVSYQGFVGDNGARKFLEDNNIKIRFVNRPRNIIEFKD